MLPEEQEERKTYLLKRKHYLMKIIDESSSDPSVADRVSNSCLAACLERWRGLAYCCRLKEFAFKSDFVKLTLLGGQLNLLCSFKTHNLLYSSRLIFVGKLL